MKRILIFSHAMELGGAERALLGLLENIDYSRCQVDLFLMRQTGELLQYLPEEVNLLPEIPQYASLAVPIGQVVRRGQFLVAAGRAVGKLMAAGSVCRGRFPSDNGVALEYSHKYTAVCMPKVGNGRYDLAVSFLTPHYFVSQKVQAQKKAAWIHTDYTKIKVDVKSELKMWAAYDYIISISEAVSQSFLKVFPSLRDKLIVIENLMPVKSIREQAEEFSAKKEMPDDGTRKLLSIGRFCAAKNFDNVPDICRRILQRGINVRWYLIGFGSDEALIQRKIVECGMEEHIVILGKKTNPYPYIKACDLYVQPSRYEGNSVSVHEAQILGKPVVITDYTTSASQLEDGIDGIIVPMENEKCAAALACILKDEAKQSFLVRNESGKDYTNADGLQKLYKLL